MSAKPKFQYGDIVQVVGLFTRDVILDRTTVLSVRLTTERQDMESGVITKHTGYGYRLYPPPCDPLTFVAEENLRLRPEPGSMDTLMMICSWSDGVEV